MLVYWTRIGAHKGEGRREKGGKTLFLWLIDRKQGVTKLCCEYGCLQEGRGFETLVWTMEHSVLRKDMTQYLWVIHWKKAKLANYVWVIFYSAGIYFIKVNNGNTTEVSEICSKLTIKIQEREYVLNDFENVKTSWARFKRNV